MSTQIPNPDPGSTISNYDESTQEMSDINLAVAQEYHRYLKELLNNPAHPITQYVRSPDRELTDEQINDWLLGYSPDEWRFITTPLIEKGAFVPAVAAGICVENGDKKYDFFRNRLMIPLFDENRIVIGFTGRSIDGQEPKYLNTKETIIFRKSELLFGLNWAKRSILRNKHLVLTEGNFDVTTLHYYGLTETVGKGGTALTEQQIKKIAELAESVTLIYDVDPKGSGQMALIKDCEKLLEVGLRVKIFHLPVPTEGGKVDADSWARAFAKQQAKPVRNLIPRHIEKAAEDGLLWLARIGLENDDIDTQVEAEKRIIALLLKVADEDRQNKLSRKVATVFSTEPKDIFKRLKRLKTEQDRPNQKATGTESEDNDIMTDSVWYRNSSMSMMVKSGKGAWSTVASNFHLFIKYCTKDEEENLTWVLEIRPDSVLAEPLFIEVSHDDWTSATKLKKIITGNFYSLKASDNELSEIQSYLFAETKFCLAKKITKYGFHPESGVFFFANKAVVNGQVVEPDQFGMVYVQKEPRTMVLSAPVNKKHKAERFTLTDTEITVNEFFALYTQSQQADNAFIPLCFYVMSLFRDVCYSNRKFLPILFIKGGKGTGKSSMMSVLTAVFGKKQDGINLGQKNTEASLVKLMSQASNCFILMEEYHHDLGSAEKLLQAMYDGHGYHRSKDNTSIDTDLVSIDQALALTSNHLPKTDVFFDRCLFIPVNSQEFTAEQTAAFNRLRDLEEAGVGCLTVELLQYRELVEKGHLQAFETLQSALKEELKYDKIPGGRLISNMAQVMSVAFILASAGKIRLTEEEGQDTVLEEMVRVGANNIRRQHRIMSEKTSLNNFFEIIQTLYDQYQIHEEIHFDFDGANNEGDVMIRLWMPQLYTLYSEKHRRIYGLTIPPADKDTIQTELAVLMGYPDWDSLKKPIRFKNDGEGRSTSKTVPRNNSCQVSYDILQERFGLDLSHRKPKPNGFGS